MKKIERSDMPTLDLAWKAHKMRNRIAHEGTRYQLSPQEAWRAYKMYETIFKSARFI